MPLTPAQVEEAILAAQSTLKQLARKFRGLDYVKSNSKKPEKRVDEDLVQAANLKLLEVLPSYDAPSNIQGYIRIVARNAMQDFIRVERGRPGQRPEMKQLDDPGQSNNFPVREAAEEYNAVHVEKRYNASLTASVMLMQLTDVQRKVVWAVAAEEKTFAEVGEELGLSRSRAHQIYVEAVDLLRGGGQKT